MFFRRKKEEGVTYAELREMVQKTNREVIDLLVQVNDRNAKPIEWRLKDFYVGNGRFADEDGCLISLEEAKAEVDFKNERYANL